MRVTGHGVHYAASTLLIKGPVTVTLRLPEVTITDSEGRHIVISPEQAEVVGSKMDAIAYWLEDVAEIDNRTSD